MAATFPGGIKVFTTKQAGDQIASAHINDLQDEVVAVETELRKTTGSVVSHGSLAGLSNNDHPQYLLNSGWQSYTPTWVADTNPSIGDGALSGSYFRIGKLVYCQFRMKAGSTTTFGSGMWRFSYPVAPNLGSATLYQVGVARVIDIGTSEIIGFTANYAGGTSYMGIIANGAWLTPTSPFTWSATNGDVLEVNVIYEAA